jgi:hypothetical protein
MRKQDWRGAALIASPWVGAVALMIACVLVAWFGINANDLKGLVP